VLVVTGFHAANEGLQRPGNQRNADFTFAGNARGHGGIWAINERGCLRRLSWRAVLSAVKVTQEHLGVSQNLAGHLECVWSGILAQIVDYRAR